MELFKGQHLIVGSLYIHKDSIVHHLQSFQYPDSLVLREDRFLMLDLPDISVIANSDYQYIAHILAALQQI